MSIRNKAFAALALASLLGVTACGSTKDDPETAATPAATEAATEGAARPAGRSRRA